ncbi:MAG: sensor domain-containing diguanylate cyclase, partial [Candidatus Manganitrophaceae bacterium]
ASSLDYETTLASVARLAVPYLADGCVVDILEENQTVRRLAVAATDPAKEEIGRELLRRYPPDPTGRHPLHWVLQTGKPVFLPQITEEMLASVARDEAHLKVARSLGLKSALIVPILARERTLGAISFVLTDSSRRYRPVDLALAEDLARRAGLAIDNSRLYRAAQEEIKERKRAEDHLQFMAEHDALTNLPNRVVFSDRLNQAISRARRYRKLIAVLFLDLDGFKNINDSLGHETGDRLLKETADRLVRSVRESDTVSRLGGDEFTLLLPDIVEPQAILGVVQTVLNVLAKPFNLDGYKISITASVGVSFYPLDGEDPDTLLKNADKAMYRAKERGRNNFQLYSPSNLSQRASPEDSV